MRVGIYARKSKFSDKSDSVEAQLKMCEEYAHSNYKVSAVVKYDEDEGYTGANTKRPGFKRLMHDVKEQKIDVLICYKIDRVSRNVLDFSKTFEVLQENNIQFVSIKEQIDTSTPLGRAMMYICSVFAQMERETTAERVKDSMIELAKSGKWTGGKPPLGYKLERVTVGGKKHTILSPDESELQFMHVLYDTFLQGFSLGGLETYFKKNRIRTLQGNYMTASQAYLILKNPHGVENTKQVYDYFENLGCTMVNDRGKYDGEHGLIVYGRTTGGKTKKHTVNGPDKWIVGIGLHKPIVSADKWLKVQNQFGLNVIDKTRKHEIGILKGMLKCKCGYTMRVQHKEDKIYHKVYDNYFCQQRNRKGKEYCDMKMVGVDKLDNMVIKYLKNISIDKSLLSAYLVRDNVPQRDCTIIKKDIDKTIKKIGNLTATLQDNYNSSAAKYIIAEIEKLDNQVAALNYELRKTEINQKRLASEKENIDAVYNAICEHVNDFSNLNYDEQSLFIKDIIRECVWDGKELFIAF